MNDAIIIDYEPFSQESRIYVMKNGQRSSYRVATDVKMLAQEVIVMAQETQIYNVKVHAPLAFISEINRQVKQLEITTYSENKISVGGL